MHVVVEECILHLKGDKLQFSVEFQKYDSQILIQKNV